MARALRIQYPGAYYHVTCRGNERKRIYYDDRDRVIFTDKLLPSLRIYNVILHAYIYMLNHFHLLLSTPDGNLSDFMRHFNISYTSAFNRRHKRTGHLYAGRYKAFLIDADNYLLATSRYIHINPIRIKAISNKPAEEKYRTLTNYKWSSLGGYLSARKREEFVNYGTTLEYMGGDNRKGRQAYRQFIISGLGSDVENPLKRGIKHGIIGDEDFVSGVTEKFVKKESAEREQPAIRALKKPDQLIKLYVEHIGSTGSDICRRGKKSTERATLMELLYRFCNVTQSEIGKLVGGIDYSAVSQARRRLRIRMEKDQKLKENFKKFLDQLA